MAPSQEEFIDFGQTLQLCRNVVHQIQTSGWRPNLVVGLAGSGFFPAVWIAKMLGGVTVVGIDTVKRDGIRSLGGAVYLASDRVYGNKILVVDDATISGKLLSDTRRLVEGLQGEARTAALVAIGNCPPPDYRGCDRQHTPQFFWELAE